MRPRSSMPPGSWLLKPFAFAAFLLPLLALPLSSCATKKPWQPEGVTEIRVLNSNSEKCGVVKDPELVREVIACLSRATPSGEALGLSRRWSHKLDVVGTSPECGRWLYAEKSGEYMLLTLKEVSVQKLTAEDHDRLNTILPRKVEDPLAELRASQ